MAVGGVENLKKTVLNQNLCTACGACANLCPYIDVAGGRAVIIESCGLKEGKCYAFCPRTYLDIASLDQKIFGSQRKNHALGFNKMILKGRAKNPEIYSISQYGGVVSALITYALEIGEIDVAVLAKSSDGVNPQPAIARKRDEVLECARSKYLACPTVSAVLEAIKREKGNVGFVGTPCQVAAVRKMQVSELKPEANKIKLILGLFCTWALQPSAHEFIREKVGEKKILKLDVPPPPANIFIIQTEREKLEIPLDELRKFIMPTCNVCFDMTNEFADISVGTVEGEEDWNTIITRTDEGEKILQKAMNDGVLETRPLEKDRLDHLYEASLTRKKRVLTEMPPEKVAYLLLNEEDKLKIIKGG
ncbi:MAG: Coenzyme F420 hydrogenase/dehydrogenase, beta subunit C-terminal domain [Candidatus Bathycorpusculaceae bacterium]